MLALGGAARRPAPQERVLEKKWGLPTVARKGDCEAQLLRYL